MRGVRSSRAGALAICVATALCGVSSARAHGAVPRAAAPLLGDANGIELLQLSRGLALRRADGFHYYCPAHWDKNENDPAVPLPNGPALLGLASGLALIAADGSTTRYPEQDLGTTVALASTGLAAYALSLRAGNYELRRIERDHSELLWSAPQSNGDWQTLGASDQSLLLLGLERGQLSQLQLTNSGSEPARVTASVALDTLSVQAQLVGTTPYLILQSESGDRIELGRIANGQWMSLARASGNLAGPVQTSEGKLVVAIDGALASFDDEHVTPLGGSDFVTGLARFGSATYASVHAGLSVLSAGQPGALVFDFATLAEPLYDGLTATERADCLSAWQHLQVDLVAAGLTGVRTPPDAGAPATAATATADAATQQPSASASDAAARAPDGGTENTATADAATAQAASDRGGCAMAAPAPTSDGALSVALLAFATARGTRRRRGR